MKILFFALFLTLGLAVGHADNLQPDGSDLDSIMNPAICQQPECADYMGATKKGTLTGEEHLSSSGKIGSTKIELQSTASDDVKSDSPAGK